MNSRRKHIPWKRFWCPLGAQINSEPTGAFLANPESEFGRDWSANTFTLEELLDRRCLVLCGEPGMGKTSVITQFIAHMPSLAVQDQRDLLPIEFRNIPDFHVFEGKTFESNQWKRWQESSLELTLLIDGVDEGLFVIRSFIEYLTDRLLAVAPLDRLRLILVCRTLEWPQSPGEALLALWQSSQEMGEKSPTGLFELCPLRRADVEVAAETSRINPAAFLEVVCEKHLQSLAARPVTLFMLLDEFAAEGTISKSHHELYESACRSLCKEPDKDRWERLRLTVGIRDQYSPARLYEIGSRTAAMLMLGGKSSVFRGDASDATESDLPLETIAQGTEKDEAGAFLVTESLVTATLATNLFDSKGSGRFGFQHQTLAECMAGAYLHRMGLTQLRSLLCKRDTAGEYVIPQLAEVAAWVAVDRVDFFNHLVELEPEILLRSDVTNLRAEQKTRLTMALLEKTRRAEHFQDSDRRAFYSALSHQGLTDLLRTYILDASLNVVVRRLAIDIAVACKLKELLDDFLSILRRGNDPVAEQVGYALDDLVDEGTAPALIQVVDGTFQPHVSSSTRRTALLGLLKTTWSVADSLPHLHELALSDHWLDWQVVRWIKQGDVIPILREMRNWRSAFNSCSCLHRVVDRTCSLALERIDEPVIAELLAAVIVQALGDHSLPWRGEEGAFISRVSTDANARHALIGALLSRETLDDDALLHIASQLCLPEDLGWLLEELDVVSESVRGRLAKVISYLSAPDRVAPFWDLFLDRLEHIPELKQHFAWLRACEIEGPEGRTARAHWKRQLRREKKIQRLLERHKTPPREELMVRALSEVSSGKPVLVGRYCGLRFYSFRVSSRV